MNISKFKIPMKTACGVLFSIGLATTSAPVFAGVDSNGVFQLDGNAEKNDPVMGGAGDDWDTLYDDATSPYGNSTAFTGIVSDKNGTDDIFTGGKSKSNEKIEDWIWKSSPPPPDKDNLTHTYAANYLEPGTGDQIVYFGADLFSENGDAEIAFWLFQDEVTKNGITMGDFEGMHIPVSGNMTPGDPYIAVQFSQGGTIANIAVYKWDPTCSKADGPGDQPAGNCATKNIRVVIAKGSARCDGLGDKRACAITNTAVKPSPWPYTPKSGPADMFPITTFFEGGLNVFETLGANLCFSSFMVETGSSGSWTSVSKDFGLDDFNVCSIAATKQCLNDDESDDEPDNITYDVRGCVYNDGGGTVDVDADLLNSIGGGATYTPTDLTWYIPGMVDDGGGLRPFNPATDCDGDHANTLLAQAIASGTETTDLTGLEGGDAFIYYFTEESAVPAISDEVTANATISGGDTDVGAATATDTCPDRTFNAALEVVKQCAADLEVKDDNVVVKINIQGTVCNKGEVTLTNLTLEDTPTATFDTFTTTLAPQGEEGDCIDYTGSYYPASIPDGNICPFMDSVVATATAPDNSEGTGCEAVDGTIECTDTSNAATCNLRAVDDDESCATGPLSELPE